MDCHESLPASDRIAGCVVLTAVILWAWIQARGRKEEMCLYMLLYFEGQLTL